jgi:IS605 OrfB family transposase
MPIITRKIKLIAVGETSKDRTANYNYVKRIASDLTQVGNEVIRLHICNQFELDKLKTSMNITKGESLKIFQENIGTSVQNSGYQMLTKFPYIASDIRTNFNQKIFKTIKENFHDIMNSKMSIPSFRKTSITIPFSSGKRDECVIFLKDDEHIFNFPLSSSEKTLHKEIQFKLHYGRDRSNNRIIVDRILDGTYKMNGSSIQIVDNDLYMLLTCDIPVVESKDIDPNKVMGIDLGINRPVSIYIDGEKRQPTQISIGEKIQSERMKFFKQRKAIQQSMKSAKGGHGRKRKMLGMDKLREKESNWSKNINHEISRQVINIAQQYNVGIIKMEDLTGITTNSKDYFLKSWAYYQLQTDIEYKGKMVGIKILWVNPKDTSITCPTCKNVDKENRNDKDKTKFSCINIECDDYAKQKDADIVGAYNITYVEGSEVKGKSKAGRLLKGKQKKQNIYITTSDGAGCTAHSDSLNKQGENVLGLISTH